MSALFDRLREVRPSRVYVAIDGPRDGNVDDEKLVAASCSQVETIDWPADVRTRFLQANLGCGRAVSSAIEWFLTHEERGIVLEDDVLPHPTFFEYCSQLLDRYSDDERVLTINGHNLVPSRGQSSPDQPYRFTRYTEMWGWALWRRTWSQYEFEIPLWREVLGTERIWEMCGRSVPQALFWGAMFDHIAAGRVDSWDVQLEMVAMRFGQAMAVPNLNLTANTGFGPDATHYTQKSPMMQPVGAMSSPIPIVDYGVDETADRWFHRHHFQVELRTQQLLQRRSSSFQEFVEELKDLHRRKGNEQTT